MGNKGDIFKFSGDVRGSVGYSNQHILHIDELYQLIDKMGVTVIEGNYAFHSIDYGGDKVIFKISKGLSKELKKFEVSHLLGHLLMHANENDYNDNIFNRGLDYNREQMEANLFGISLICPVEKTKDIVDKNIIGSGNSLKYNLTQIAKDIGVTENITRNYMKELGYII